MDLNGGTSEWPISRGSHAVFVNLRELETFKTNLENVACVLWETANHATVKRYICTHVPACYDGTAVFFGSHCINYRKIYQCRA